jgi:hypothetical protein
MTDYTMVNVGQVQASIQILSFRLCPLLPIRVLHSRTSPIFDFDDFFGFLVHIPVIHFTDMVTGNLTLDKVSAYSGSAGRRALRGECTKKHPI